VTAPTRNHDAHDRIGVGILLLYDRGQRLGWNRPHRAGDLFAHGIGRVFEVALQDELDLDVGGAAGVDRCPHLIDAGDAAEGVLHRHDDGRRHLVGSGARQPQLHIDLGGIGLREEIDAEVAEREQAKHDQRRHQHRREHRPADAEL
jgi:hypothetical protein